MSVCFDESKIEFGYSFLVLMKVTVFTLQNFIFNQPRNELFNLIRLKFIGPKIQSVFLKTWCLEIANNSNNILFIVLIMPLWPIVILGNGNLIFVDSSKTAFYFLLRTISLVLFLSALMNMNHNQLVQPACFRILNMVEHGHKPGTVPTFAD